MLDRSSPAPFVRFVMGPMTRALNLPVRRLAGRRHFGLVAQIHHTGRRSGRAYITPAGARLAGDHVLIPLTFGSRSDWSRNVRAAGGCTVVLRGATYRSIHPDYLKWSEAWPQIHDAFSPIERGVFRVLGIKQFLRLQIATTNDHLLARQAPTHEES
jgi:deazaflavin-dependent oxidoreductase (nitroreductase family)